MRLICSKGPRQKQHWTLDHFVTSDNCNESSELRISSNIRDSTWQYLTHGTAWIIFDELLNHIVISTWQTQPADKTVGPLILFLIYLDLVTSKLKTVRSSRGPQNLTFHHIALRLPNTAGCLIEIVLAKWIVVLAETLVPFAKTEKNPSDT